MLLAEVAATSRSVAGTPGRLAKVASLASLLRRLAPSDAAIVVPWLCGELPQRQIGVGWAALKSLPEAVDEAQLSIREVDAVFSSIKIANGAGSQARRHELLTELFGHTTASEQFFLRGLLAGDLRQGALAGVLAEAIASATGASIAAVRRAAMLSGDLGAVAEAALTSGTTGLTAFRLEVGRPISPMLAQTASSAEDALQRVGGHALVEWKLDGARIQVHRAGSDVAIFTRSLDDVTGRMPEIVASIMELPARELVADGEVIALRPDGRPFAFQRTAARVGTSTATGRTQQSTPLTAFLFDLLHLDGTDLLDASTHDRVSTLDELVHTVPAIGRIGRIVTDEPKVAAQFLRDTIDRGHEGVVVKSPTAPYDAGRRGAGWLKVKPVHTLDLVVLAVEWGSGRRKGWLSNIHLGARSGDGFVMLGKTFKGMTDSMLTWQTDRFRSLAVGPLDQWVVALHPEQVVEVAFDGVQVSTRYPGGVALRFARVVRYRDDKIAADADTLETVRSFLASS